LRRSPTSSLFPYTTLFRSLLLFLERELLLLDLLLERLQRALPLFLGAALLRPLGLLLLDHSLQRVDLLARRPLELLDALLELIHALRVCHRRGDSSKHPQHTDDGGPRTSLKSHVAPPDRVASSNPSWSYRDGPSYTSPAEVAAL